MKPSFAGLSMLGLALLLTPSPAAAAIRAPTGVGIATVVPKVPFPTNLAFDPAGGLWITSGGTFRRTTDGVWYVPRGSRKARHVVQRLDTALGLAWQGGELFVSSRWQTGANKRHFDGRVDAFAGFDGKRFAKRRLWIRDLPSGLHGPDSIAPGPDGRLYTGVGSRTNAGPARLQREATVLSFLPRGARSDQRVEARGLRNPYGLAFLPGTTRLFASDNGRDDLGDTRPPDELNAFDVEGAVPHFGWPRRVGSPFAELPAHAAAGGVAATADWDGKPAVFVASNGNTIGRRAGADVRIAHPDRPGRAAVFARGFEHFDPLGAAIGPGGELYVTLYTSGRVMRFTPPRA